MDFIVLDTQPVPNIGSQIPVILGRPFLATSNAIINCRDGVLKLSFGNLNVKLNVFNAQQQHPPPDDYYAVHMIDILVDGAPPWFCPTDPLAISFINFNVRSRTTEGLNVGLKDIG